jgi:hypothetical protein
MSHLRQVDVRYLDGPNVDAFGRLRVSTPDTLFDSRFRYNLDPLIYFTSTANGGAVAHDADLSSAVLSLDGTADGEAVVQSKQYHRYVPGKSQLVAMTSVFGSAVGTVVRRAGYFDANDGIFLEQNGTTDVAFVRRTSTSGSPVDNRVAQSAWNLDRLDGSGSVNPSGLTLDLSKGQILFVDFQWLGMGRVRVGFDIDGEMVVAHEFLNANALSVPFMKTGSLPVRWEISGDAAADMMATCATVQSEGGGEQHFGSQFSYTRPANVTAASGAQTHAFSLRPKATFNSITNRIPIRFLEFFNLAVGTNPVLVEVYYDTTVGGTPSWADVDATYSAMQVDTAGTPSGGVKVLSFFTGTQAGTGASVQVHDFLTRHPLVLSMDGTGFTNMTVYVTGIGGTSATRPGVIWEELR